MTLDPDDRLALTPEDPEAPARTRRLQKMGIGDQPDPEFDEFARKLARTTGAPFAMVNFIDEDRQYFAGLYAPPSPESGAAAEVEASTDAYSSEAVDRVMDRDHGFCPHVVVRGKALVLEDVCDYPRFAGNPVVDKLGIRSYLGAPLLDEDGNALGTVCVVDTEPRPWGRPGLETIKEMALEMVQRIRRREQEQQSQQ